MEIKQTEQGKRRLFIFNTVNDLLKKPNIHTTDSRPLSNNHTLILWKEDNDHCYQIFNESCETVIYGQSPSPLLSSDIAAEFEEEISVNLDGSFN